ncbi:hypothetical protein K432DRAFT_385406 [Lepidopterella palustris CBS 459.81]|uniref:Uncharacterized protein n=1 Tax=Lepidopterella palustris CBS 459.81 TaxID=1314670 RepID=A0A8E2E326_9PEZI|nr:hypothetical protein K432DRAFT_385406 [Lepidopterella palustris CBS 459.81]
MAVWSRKPPSSEQSTYYCLAAWVCWGRMRAVAVISAIEVVRLSHESKRGVPDTIIGSRGVGLLEEDMNTEGASVLMSPGICDRGCLRTGFPHGEKSMSGHIVEYGRCRNGDPRMVWLGVGIVKRRLEKIKMRVVWKAGKDV